MTNKQLYGVSAGLALCAMLLTGCGWNDDSIESASAATPESTAVEPLAVFSLKDYEEDAVLYYSKELDTVSASSMGETLCDVILSDGTNLVCYWEPGSEFTKYWAIRRGNELVRFCQEESAYTSDYGVSEYTNVLGHDGFRIECPRGAAYQAYDYYYLDEDQMPCPLAKATAGLLEADLNGDGEKELLDFYHGDSISSYFFLSGHEVQEVSIPELIEQDFPGCILCGSPQSAFVNGEIPAVLRSLDQSMEDVSVSLRFTADTMEIFPSDDQQ